jgi:hypothetical protein
MVFSLGKSITLGGGLVIAALFLLSGKTFAQLNLQPLPADEDEAAVMLRDGGLDSATWEIFRPYYMQPLCVPCGELKELVDVVPEISRNVPDCDRDLAAYEPWQEKDIRRFFSDYPALVDFKPILSFETSARRFGRALISIREEEYHDPAHYADFFLTPVSALTLRGKTEIEEASARWQRRAITARFPRSNALSIGNFNLDVDGGLFYGYFPAVGRGDSLAIDDWKYGASATWNGFLYEGTLGPMVHEKAFFHRGPSETAYGIKAEVAVSRHVSIVAAASRLVAGEDGPSAAALSADYGDAGIVFKNSCWNSGALLGRARGKAAAPIFVYVNHGDSLSGLDASYAWLPAGLSAPRSSLRHEIFKKVREPDSLSVEARRIRLTCGMPLTRRIQSLCGVAYYYLPGARSAEGFVEVLGKTWLDYTVRYAYDPGISGQADRYALRATLTKKVLPMARYDVTGRVLFDSGGCTSVYVRSTLAFTPRQSLEISPFFTVYGNDGGLAWSSVGAMQTLKLSERTSGKIKVEIPVAGSNQKEWVFDAHADFYW